MASSMYSVPLAQHAGKLVGSGLLLVRLCTKTERKLTHGPLVDDLGDPPKGDARAEEGQAACSMVRSYH